ncbi:MAG: thiamine diphosphokinase [Bacteroidales bacterium]|nr:thiamine diphosphokinase [Bacteroidales bacterium]MDD4669509.1 thiamine diphosphokinase [Bacteroidales bacterium]
MKHIVILANGQFPSSRVVRDILNNADVIICCDEATEKLIKFGIVPTFIAGDMDSLSPEIQKKYRSLIFKSECQETNDLTKAFNLAKTLSPSEIDILGATGGREDHTLGNISLLLDYAKSVACPVKMVTDYGKFIAIHDTATLSCPVGRQISIFAFDNSLKIKSAGLKYPTDNVIFDSLWKASLNETSQESFTLTLSHPCGVLLFFANRK